MRYALIPAYEPDDKLLALLDALEQQQFRILLVDDGSGPQYAGIFDEAKHYATVLSYPENHGKGHALKTGYQWLLRLEALGLTVVVLDCDGQHRPEDAVRLCEAAETAPGTLILGCRKQSTASPVRSRFGNAATRGVYKLATGSRIYDTQTGMRACTRDLLPELLRISGERYEYEMNTLLEFTKAGIPMQEVPIETIYIDGNSGSHFQTLRDSWRIYKGILKFSMSSMLGFVIDYLLFSLITFLTKGNALLFANVAARLVSATVNFTVNRLVVFQDQGKLMKCAIQYALLALFILVCNSMILYCFSEVLGWNEYLSKLLTELILFVISWTVQSKLIFRFQIHKKEGITCSEDSTAGPSAPHLPRH